MAPNIIKQSTTQVECVETQSQIRSTPLLQEQPLLLEDLVEQEKKRDQRQTAPIHSRPYVPQMSN